jgi:hypothetical protein
MKEQLSVKVSVIQYYKNASGIELIRLTASENNLINTQASFDLDRLITCKFSRPKESTKKLITDLTKPHFIYIERGSLGILFYFFLIFFVNIMPTYQSLLIFLKVN